MSRARRQAGPIRFRLQAAATSAVLVVRRFLFFFLVVFVQVLFFLLPDLVDLFFVPGLVGRNVFDMGVGQAAFIRVDLDGGGAARPVFQEHTVAITAGDAGQRAGLLRGP